MSVTFAYHARTPGGERVSGTMRALDRRSAIQALRERMLVPSKIESTSPAFSFTRMFVRAKPSERLAFFRAYAALEQAGVDFSTAFGLLIAQTRTVQMRDALASIRSDVERGGEKLWAAMSRRPDDFTDLEVAMVAAGEEAGSREEVFERLASFLERDGRTRKLLASALFYPAIVCVAAVAITLFIVFTVLPQFARLFTSFGIEPSPILSVVLSLSTIVLNPLVALVLGAATVGVVAALIRLVQTPDGALGFDALRMRVPIVGPTIRKAILARICRVLATLLQSGVNLVRALEVSIPVAESPIFARAILTSRDRLAAGSFASLDEALGTSGVFPALVIGFVRTGAAAGNVPQMLVKVAEYYEEDVEAVLAALPAAIQTVVTLGLGIVVAGIVWIVYVPLATLSTSIH